MRKYTLKFSFVFGVARPKIYEFDDWFNGYFQVPEEDVLGMAYDFLSNEYIVKLRNDDWCQRIMDKTNGTAEYKSSTGEVSRVSISYAGLGLRNVKVHLLPFEVEFTHIKQALSKFGTVYAVTADRWGGNMHYKVDNGVRTVKIDLQSHIPSFVNVCGFRALVVYEGQPRTCSACNLPGHLRAECPRRRAPVQLPVEVDAEGRPRPQYASVASRLFTGTERDATPPDDVVLAAAAANSVVPPTNALSWSDDVEMSEAREGNKPTPQLSAVAELSSVTCNPADDTPLTDVLGEKEGAPDASSDTTSATSDTSPTDSPCVPATINGNTPQQIEKLDEGVTDSHGTLDKPLMTTDRPVSGAKKSKKSSSDSQKEVKGQTSPEKKKIRVARGGAAEVANQLRPVAQQVAAKLKYQQLGNLGAPATTSADRTDHGPCIQKDLDEPSPQDDGMDTNEYQT